MKIKNILLENKLKLYHKLGNKKYDITEDLLTTMMIGRNDKKEWIDLIKEIIWTEDNHSSFIYPYSKDEEFSIDNFSIWPFTIKDLKKTYYNIKPGDIVTNKKLKGIFVVSRYVTLDKRYENEYFKDDKAHLANHIVHFGNLLEVDGLMYDGRISGYNYGDYLFDNCTSYYDYKIIDYIPKEGEYLYYIRKAILGEIHWKDPSIIDKLWNSRVSIKYNAKNRDLYESWFKEYE